MNEPAMYMEPSTLLDQGLVTTPELIVSAAGDHCEHHDESAGPQQGGCGWWAHVRTDGWPKQHPSPDHLHFLDHKDQGQLSQDVHCSVRD